jgi:hypothetical protein
LEFLEIMAGCNAIPAWTGARKLLASLSPEQKRASDVQLWKRAADETPEVMHPLTSNQMPGVNAARHDSGTPGQDLPQRDFSDRQHPDKDRITWI